MQVRTGRVARRADEPDADSLPDPDAEPDVDTRKVRVHRALAMSVGDDDEEAPAAVPPPGPDDAAGLRGVDGRTHRRREVDPRVPAIAARPEAVAEHRRGHRPGEWDRNRGRRSSERLKRRRAGDAVRLQREPVLEAAQRLVDVPAEDPVEGAGGEAVLGGPELQRRNVPAFVADLELAGAEPVAGEAAERFAGLRAGDPVDRDVGTLLEAANRLRCAGPADPVDRALIEPMRVQADLEGGHARIGRRGAGGDGR